MPRARVNRSERHPGAKARLADSRNLRRLSDVHPELERLYGEAQNDDEFGDPDDGGHHALFIDAVVARRKKPINAIMITGAGGKIRVQEYFSAKLARSAFEEKRRVYRSMPGPRRNPAPRNPSAAEIAKFRNAVHQLEYARARLARRPDDAQLQEDAEYWRLTLEQDNNRRIREYLHRVAVDALPTTPSPLSELRRGDRR